MKRYYMFAPHLEVHEIVNPRTMFGFKKYLDVEIVYDSFSFMIRNEKPDVYRTTKHVTKKMLECDGVVYLEDPNKDTINNMLIRRIRNIAVFCGIEIRQYSRTEEEYKQKKKEAFKRIVDEYGEDLDQRFGFNVGGIVGDILEMAVIDTAFGSGEFTKKLLDEFKKEDKNEYTFINGSTTAKFYPNYNAGLSACGRSICCCECDDRGNCPCDKRE